MQFFPSAPIVYQLKVVLQNISPMIWRRLLIQSENTIADLHYVIQIAMGWNDEHLHQFFTHGKRYGVYHSGGILFNENPHQVKLSDFRFRQDEKFLYEYDLGDHWQHEIRVEAILPFDDKQYYLVCTGGKRATPPEDCGGAWNYMERQQTVPVQAIELFSEMFANDSALVADYVEELQALSPWLNLEHFDRRAVNRRLCLYARGDEEWRESEVEEVA